MSVVTVKSAALVGVDAWGVDVEVAIINAIPGMKTVGLPDAALKEGSERILLALRHQGLLSNRPSVIVNLAPAELQKFGARYELAIAIGILILRGQVPEAPVKELLLVGELSLHGDVRPVRGALAMAAMARANGFAAIVVPRDNAAEAALVDGLCVYAVSNLRELVEGLRGDGELVPFVPAAVNVAVDVHAPDFADVRGQSEARRAAEIAAAGGHNLLLVGPPGSGKTMIARRMPGLLPPLVGDEAIETTRVLSAAGVLPTGAGLLRTPPFRAPHHTVSSAGLVGGYVPPRPGEVSLAHNGLLFLDEMAEFSRASLESLREPMEEGAIRIIRGGVSCAFPARFMLVAATNP